MKTEQNDLVAAQKVGTRLFLAGGPRMETSFQGPSEKTLFFREDMAEEELRGLKVPLESVIFRPVTMSLNFG